ncbi:MAG: prephenate dehydrogenase/arogenate dehydrogenase family protein [Proteobacteria bacterium]|nr:prephenate dehydrogenase/arogenate dehydrogenase family protein [Pseudomonadota bacterium]
MKKHKLSKFVSACDISSKHLTEIKKLKLADEVTPNLKQSMIGSDLIIISTPLSAYKEIFVTIKKFANKNVLVTDVGSSKLEVVQMGEKILKNHAYFVPAHPIAGTEQSGPTAGFVNLFKNRWCIITPCKLTNQHSKNKIKKLWEIFGSNVTIMKPKNHDNTMAITSHIPHLIAYNIVGTAAKLESKTKSEVIKFSASGFRDFTRIASSDPTMWRDIMISNKKQILFMLKRFNQDLNNLKKAIEGNNKKKLFNTFRTTRNIRKKIIEAGQDINQPNFGRKN